ncbi:murein biosynthesis integral membrane protein MurJ [Alkalihalophilus pseudofirmus]|nr:murein biosynthesis integral membrane protein MurJ [Alkalihalophilus pseudofirmus]
MKKAAIILIILSIVSKLIGFGREMTLSYFYGASSISDAYLISLIIPVVIFSFIGRAINTGYIPMYSKIEEKSGISEANRYTSNLVSIIIVICTIIVLIGIIFAEQIVLVFASGFERETIELAANFTRISIFGVYFTGVIAVMKGFLQIKGNFTIIGLISIPMSLLTIVSIVISANVSIYLLTIGTVIATASQLLLLIPFVAKKGYSFKPILRINDSRIKEMAFLSIPVIMGVAVNDINVIVDRTIASGIGPGAISALHYSNLINGFVQGIFVFALITVMYPTISKMAATNDIKSLKKVLTESINGICLLVIPASIGCMFLAEPIVSLLFGRGAFDANAISMTSYALFFYSIGMIGFGLREVFFRAFYALQDTKTPLINALIGVTVNIILNILLSRYLGIGGLALATSIAAIFTTALMYASLRKKIGPLAIRHTFINLLKILTAALVMGALAKLCFNYFNVFISQNLSLLLALLFGVMVYTTIIYFMKINDVDLVINALKKKISKVRK